MTLLLTDSDDSKDSEDSSDLATTPSQLIKSLSPVYCTVPVRVSDCVRSVPCEREGESLGSLRNIGKLGQRPKRAKRPKRHRSLHITIVIVAVSGLLLD